MGWGMKNVVVSIFGSSIMEGRIGAPRAADRWYSLLQAALSERFPAVCFPFVNGAVGGESTRECMARFDRDILAYNPDWCLCMVGGNNHDCTRPERILAEGELERLMDDLAARLPAKTRPVGVVINPVVNDWHFVTRHPAFQDHLKPYGGLNEVIEVEREKFRKFIREHQWPSLDLSQVFAHDPGKYILREDGIHLGPAGHRLFADKMFELLEPLIAAAT